MQCPFCKHEVEKGVTECPYCHYQFEVDAEVLSNDERDSFAGVTIEEDGSTSTNQQTTYEEQGEFQEERPTRFGQREEETQQQAPGGFHFQTYNSSGCLIWAFVILCLIIFFFVAAVKLLFAVPILGVIVGGLLLNSMFHWF